MWGIRNDKEYGRQAPTTVLWQPGTHALGTFICPPSSSPGGRCRPRPRPQSWSEFHGHAHALLRRARGLRRVGDVSARGCRRPSGTGCIRAVAGGARTSLQGGGDRVAAVQPRALGVLLGLVAALGACASEQGAPRRARSTAARPMGRRSRHRRAPAPSVTSSPVTPSQPPQGWCRPTRIRRRACGRRVWGRVGRPYCG